MSERESEEKGTEKVERMRLERDGKQTGRGRMERGRKWREREREGQPENSLGDGVSGRRMREGHSGRA